MAKREKLGHRLKRVRIARDLSLARRRARSVSRRRTCRASRTASTRARPRRRRSAPWPTSGDNFDELMQLAGRARDVEKLIKADPDMPVMLRRAREQNVTGAEFLEWLETKKKGANDSRAEGPLPAREAGRARGNELLHKYAKDKGKPVRAPIDVENILEGYFKLDLVYIDLPDFIGVPDVLGATFIKDQRVFIDESLMIEGQGGRLAFTLAHEGGHWYLAPPAHRDGAGHRHAVRQGRRAQAAHHLLPLQPEEGARRVAADGFAAALLMPAADVRHRAGALRRHAADVGRRRGEAESSRARRSSATSPPR